MGTRGSSGGSNIQGVDDVLQDKTILVYYEEVVAQSYDEVSEDCPCWYCAAKCLVYRGNTWQLEVVAQSYDEVSEDCPCWYHATKCLVYRQKPRGG